MCEGGDGVGKRCVRGKHRKTGGVGGIKIQWGRGKGK